MIKKIKANDLCCGMFIHDLDCKWLDHPFMRSQFQIESESDIKKIIEFGLQHVYIDTDRGEDLSLEKIQFNEETPPPSYETQVFDMGELSTPARTTPIQTELVRAKKICLEANAIITSTLFDARIGKKIEPAKVQPVVSTITDSIFRNPDALISLLRIKQADTYTFQHSIAVCALLVNLCHTMKMERSIVEQVGLGGLLHDIGKTKIPMSILNKPGKLSHDEFQIMQKHVAYGWLLLENLPEVTPIAIKVVAEHHERFDGSGYPQSLDNDKTSIYGQLAAIADVYDALTSVRVYHQAQEPTEVLQKLLESSQQHFNPELVHYFIRSTGIYPVGSLVRLESDRLAIVIEQNHQDLLHPTVRTIFDIDKNSYTTPIDIDLSKNTTMDKIVTAEKPSRWKINLSQHL